MAQGPREALVPKTASTTRLASAANLASAVLRVPSAAARVGPGLASAAPLAAIAAGRQQHNWHGKSSNDAGKPERE